MGRERPVIRRERAQLADLVWDDALHLRMLSASRLDAARLGLEILGGAQPLILNRRISAALGEFPIPRCPLARLFRIGNRQAALFRHEAQG